jgi:hypothetical protein
VGNSLFEHSLLHFLRIELLPKALVSFFNLYISN